MKKIYILGSGIKQKETGDLSKMWAEAEEHEAGTKGAKRQKEAER